MQLVGIEFNRIIKVEKNNISNELCCNASAAAGSSSSSEYTDERNPWKSKWKWSSNSDSTFSHTSTISVYRDVLEKCVVLLAQYD